VKILYLVGIQDAIRLARSMGITALEGVERYGLTLVLGGGEVSLLDLVSSYGVFAAEGVRYDYRSVLRIEESDGSVVREYSTTQNRVLDANVANTISDMLSDNEARAPAFGTNSPLYFANNHVASKTGTTNDSRDAWIVGYSPNIAVGAWAGNNDNSPMVKSVAGFIIAPLWRSFMEEALEKFPKTPFPEPRSTVTEADKPVLRGVWTGSGNTIDIHSILYWVDKDNPRGPRPEDPSQDAQYASWEYSVRLWASKNGFLPTEEPQL